MLLRRPDGTLLPVTSAAHGLVPGGISLPCDADHRALVALAGRSASLDLAAWGPLLGATRPTDLTVAPGPVDLTAARALAAAALAPTSAGPVDVAMDPGPSRRRARALVRAGVEGDLPAVRLLLHILVGTGPGSTPSGDDVVVGVLAGLDRRADAAARRASSAVRATLPDLLHRTTSVSRHDLAAAADGEVAERVHELLAATAHASRVPGAVTAARAWGATSGLDLAAGVAAGALGTRAWAARPDRPRPTTPTTRDTIHRRSA